MKRLRFYGWLQAAVVALVAAHDAINTWSDRFRQSPGDSRLRKGARSSGDRADRPPGAKNLEATRSTDSFTFGLTCPGITTQAGSPCYLGRSLQQMLGNAKKTPSMSSKPS
jgi:hypothetical protein